MVLQIICLAENRKVVRPWQFITHPTWHIRPVDLEKGDAGRSAP